jgi:hypothetical protein
MGMQCGKDGPVRRASAASVWRLRVGPMADTFQRVAGVHWSRTVIIRSEWSRYTKWSYNSANIIRKWLHTTQVYLLIQVSTCQTELKLYYTFPSVNETSLCIAELAIKRSRPPWFHREFVTRIGLIRASLVIYWSSWKTCMYLIIIHATD